MIFGEQYESRRLPWVLDDIDSTTSRRPSIKHDFEAIVRLTPALYGQRLHLCVARAGYARRNVLGHEGVGVVEEVGKGVRK